MESPTPIEASQGSAEAGLAPFVPPALRRWPALAGRGSGSLDVGASDPAAAVSQAAVTPRVVVMFIDVAGFTQLSERLSRKGPEGAELLDRAIADYFDDLLEITTRYGGAAVKIAGDSVTLLFQEGPRGEVDVLWRAALCADALRTRSSRASQHGALAHKIGLGLGALVSGVVGEPGGRRELVLGGPALEQAVEAEHHATAGEVWLGRGFGDRLDLTQRFNLGPPTADGARALLSLRGPAPEVDPAALPAETPADPWLPLVPSAVRVHAARADLSFLSRHQSVTVLFVGFPELRLDSPDALGSLDVHYREMSRIVEAHGGFLSEFEAGDKGSKLIVLFGAPQVLEDPAAQAVACAFRMQERGRDLGVAGSQRIGMSTGRLFVGRIGCREILKYSALGDRMNLAARLMTAAAPWEVLADAHTAQRTLPSALWGVERTLTLKGKGEPVAVHDLVALRSARERRRGSGLIGRGPEAITFKARVAALQVGVGAILDVSGPAGSGKTRFIQAMRYQLPEGQQIAVAHWRGRDIEQRAALLAPWRPVLELVIGVEPTLERPARSQRFHAWLDGLDAARRHLGELLAPLLEVDGPPGSREVERPPKVLVNAVVETLLRAAEDMEPRLVLLEGLDAFDSLSQDVLAGLAPAVGRLPLLLVTTRRAADDAEPYPVPGLHGHAVLTPVPLGPLCDEDGATLLAQRLGVGRVDPELAELVKRRAQGVPLLVEAWADALRDSGRLRIEAGAAWLVGEDTSHLPEQFEALVLARLEHLPPEAQTTLRVASVVLTPFHPAEIAQLHPSAPGEDAVREHLALGARAGLVYYERERVPWMYFSRAEVRDAVHESLPFHLRRSLHRRRAAMLAQAQGDAPVGDDLRIILAEHHVYGGTAAQQAASFAAAMDVTARRYAHRETVRWSRLTIGAAQEQGDVALRLSALDAMQHAQALLAEDVQRKATLTWMYETALDLGDARAQVSALSAKARMLQRQGALDDALCHLEDAAAIAEDAGPDLQAEVLNCRAVVLGEASRAEESVEAARQALALCPADSRDLRAEVLTNLGFALDQRGRHAEALPYLEEALGLARAAGRLWEEAVLEGNIGIGLWEVGQPELGYQALRRALELKRWVGDRKEVALGLMNLGNATLQLGDTQSARRSTEEALDLQTRVGYARGQMFCVLNLGQIARVEGDLVEAAARLQELGRMLEANPHKGLELERRIDQGELALALERPQDAIPAFEAALQLARSRQNRPRELAALEGLGYARARAGEAAQGLAELEAAIAGTLALGERPSGGHRLWWRAAEVAWAVGSTQGDALAREAVAQMDAELARLGDPATVSRVVDAFPWNRAIRTFAQGQGAA